MKPHKKAAEAAQVSVPPEGVNGSHRLRKFTGNYYRALGWIGIATTFISIATAYWTDYLHFDISFVFWFWLGNCLRDGHSAARKWAIAIFLIVVSFVVIGFFIPEMKANFGSQEFEKSHPGYYATVGFIVLVFSVPGVVLLGARGRAAFAGNGEG